MAAEEKRFDLIFICFNSHQSLGSQLLFLVSYETNIDSLTPTGFTGSACLIRNQLDFKRQRTCKANLQVKIAHSFYSLCQICSTLLS